MKKILSILLVGLLAVMVISCNKNNKNKPVEITLDELGLDVRDIPRILAELSQKGLNVRDTIYVEPNEYLLGLYKLNQMTEEEINQVSTIEFVEIKIGYWFYNEGSDASGAKLTIDFRASINEIKNYVLKNAAFVYNEHLEELRAYHECKELGEFIRKKGMGPLEKSMWINWRQCLIGLKKLSFISEYEIVIAHLGRVEIKIGKESEYRKLGNAEVEISYKASLEEIKKFLLIE